MIKIKKCITLAVAGLMLLSFTGCNIIERTPESIGKTILGNVDGEKITRADVDKLLTYQLTSYKEKYGEDFENNTEIKETIKKTRTSALDNLISQKVLMNKKEDVGITLTDEEIQTQVDQQIESIKTKAGTDEAFLKLLAQYGYTEEEFQTYMKEQIILGAISEKLVKDVTVTDEELQNYYKENLESLKINPGATVTCIEFTDATKGEAQAKAARALSVSGKTFDQIKAMEEYKDDESVTVQDLGHQDFENNTKLPTAFVTAFKNLKVDEISQPVQNNGWQLIKNTVVNTEIITPTFEAVKTQVETTVLNQKKEAEYQSKLEGFKAEMDIKTYNDKY